MGKKSGIIYVLAGKSSQKMKKYIYPPGNYIMEMEHPVSASYKDIDWECKDVFNNINKILVEHDKDEIFWNREDWERVMEAPF
jgi:uracil DNA glycosylase